MDVRMLIHELMNYGLDDEITVVKMVPHPDRPDTEPLVAEELGDFIEVLMVPMNSSLMPGPGALGVEYKLALVVSTDDGTKPADQFPLSSGD